MATSSTNPRRRLARADRVVVKIGSRLIAERPHELPALIASEIAAIRAQRSVRFVLVSSGAIALGVDALGLDHRPVDLPALQAAAAVGQGRLVQLWERAFVVHQMMTAQVLLVHADTANRERFLNARHALRALLDAGVVPVVNENDTVSVEEICYGDNDYLAALVCNLIEADAMVVLTDVDGVLERGQRVSVVDASAYSRLGEVLGDAAPDRVGSGGMRSKAEASRVAARGGAVTLVTSGRGDQPITRALAGEDVGTLFVPDATPMSSRKHWLAYATRPSGRILIDAGARDALVDGKKSLLAVGLVRVEGAFGPGDLVLVCTADGLEIARGLVAYHHRQVHKIVGMHSTEVARVLAGAYAGPVIHRDDLVLS